MDITFTRSYEYQLLTEIPSPEVLPHFYYPGASTKGGKDGLLICIRPNNGTSWLATFAFGQNNAVETINDIFAMPNRQQLCVVARGTGYLVNVYSPTAWECIPSLPITDVRQVPAQHLILFSDYTRLTAYGPEGRRWKSDRLGLDGLRITQVADQVVKGTTVDPTNGDKLVGFSVNLLTGKLD